MASITLALGLIFSQEATNTLEPLETVIYIRFFSLLGISSILLFTKSKITLTKKAIPILFFQGILETSGYFCLVSAYIFDKVSIAVVISSGFGLVTIILARLILKEQISKLQSAGIFFNFFRSVWTYYLVKFCNSFFVKSIRIHGYSNTNNSTSNNGIHARHFINSENR